MIFLMSSTDFVQIRSENCKIIYIVKYLKVFTLFFSEDAGLCGLNGCPFHGMCLRDTKLGKYKCQCPECYALDKPNYVCGKSILNFPKKQLKNLMNFCPRI